MARQDVTTLAAQDRIAAVKERLEEAIAVLGGVETFDGEGSVDRCEMDTVVWIKRVGVEKVYEALRVIEKLDPEARHG